MTEVINFKCGACGKAYSVKPNYAGREFACKDCGTRLCVPQAGQDGFHVDAQVEMDSGAEVMRKTTSGREVKVDPTRVFKKQRETSARMGAVPEPVAVQEKSSSKMPLVVIVVLLVLLGGGVGGAFALGVFDPKENNGGGGQVATNTPESNQAEPEQDDSARSGLKELESVGSDTAKLLALFERAEAAGLTDMDLGTIGRKVVSAMLVDQGGTLADERLMKFAERLESIDERGEAMEVYKVVINRNRSNDNPPQEVADAHKALGHQHIDFTPVIMRASDLADYGIHDDIPAMHEELVEMDGRSDQGWVMLPDKQRYDEISARLEEAESEIESLKTDDPFVLEAALVRRRFAAEPLSRQGDWIDFVVEPYIIFVQLVSRDETKEQAERRVKTAIERTGPFAEFFDEQFAEPLNLERTMPSALNEEERQRAPYEVLMFRSFSHWQNYLNDYSEVTQTAQEESYFMEAGTGRASCVFREEWDTRPNSTTDDLTHFKWLLAEQQFFCHHPRAPKTKSQHDDFDTLTSYILRAHLRVSMMRENVTEGMEGNTYQFFVDENDPARRLKLWNRPTQISESNQISAFGGPAMTVSDLIATSELAEAATLARARLETYEGWNDDALDSISSSRNIRNIFGSYLRGFYDFIWNFTEDGETPKYRQKFRNYILKDLDGEVDPEDPRPVFEKAFELEGDWSELEQDWIEYQTAE